MIVIQFDEALTPMSEHGALVITQGVDALMRAQRLEPFQFFGRHIQGDWGDICDEDRGLNEEALMSGNRLMSVYNINDELKIWIITEADRSVTTILLPEEY
ncbi:hypothetical protein DMX02_04050 [Pseudomonas jessenii]|jgi:hypothetical protein|uniref:Plasmid related protein n=2 Tax=Pseudomonas TaxID=286 RepID=A0A9E6NK09_9PSED|nr:MULTISPECIES: hypothetical protein [Pseudomonas]PYC25239.1 hypothetical protein DMX02_04050 [Pseudomonas jessenii]QXI09131.1 hypothetical protein HU754_014810 [Pseudomonas zeae]VVM53901.1 hypothetical protein PS624_00929 [Pseudomonas fluorescens]